MGLFEPRHGSVRINPAPDDLVGPGDELILIRPTCAAMAEYQPLDVPVLTDPGEDMRCSQQWMPCQPNNSETATSNWSLLLNPVYLMGFKKLGRHATEGPACLPSR